MLNEADELKPKALNGDLAKRGLGQALIVAFLLGTLGLAASSQHSADRLSIENRRLQGRIEASCDVLGVPPGDACREEIRRLREQDLRREGAALVLPDPVNAPKPERTDAPPVPNARRDRIRDCLRDINRVLDGRARRAAECRDL